MQSSKPVISRNTRSKSRKGWRIPAGGGAILFFSALVIWLGTQAYVLGQFEIKQSILILNREGCVHLQQFGITPLPQSESNTCRIELPFRQNLLNAGGRIWVEERYISIPEYQLIGSSPLPDPPWTSHHWYLVLLECLSMLLLLLSAWILLKCLQKEDQ
ncbi:MAG TPA: hypothetical protein VF296_05225 [Gallionella sp.]